MSASIQLKGIVTDVFPTEKITDKFQKRVFWLKEPDSERYPEHWALELQQSNVDLGNKLKAGDNIVASVNIKGKKYAKNGKEGIFNTLVCWKIDKGDGSALPAGGQTTSQPTNIDEPMDDLPF